MGFLLGFLLGLFSRGFRNELGNMKSKRKKREDRTRKINTKKGIDHPPNHSNILSITQKILS